MSEGNGIVDTMNKQDVEAAYGVSLTDTQWKAILWELKLKEDDSVDDDVIADVLDDLEWHEQDYLWWQSRLPEISSKE
tara:strand:+ start:376 stop:609 length:234 start_codon:yes stop_codon:yes gene_type:complete